MHTRILQPTILALVCAFYAPPAEACGGLFCNNVPVEQVGEQIIFTVDPSTNTTHAVINISYQGPSEQFAWLLPLPASPRATQVGPSDAFVIAQRLTQPRFTLTEVEETGFCEAPTQRSFGEDAEFAPAAAPEDDGVQVLDRSQVGPYEKVELSGTDVVAVRRWLVENGYFVTDPMMRSVAPYIEDGDVLLALRLEKDQDVGDIQPLWLELPASTACIPIRLTAIAAQADMDVLAYVFSDLGRAIPQNYFHVEPNLARIDWFSGGNNYREVIGAAADEAGGNAFTTEFAGSSSLFNDAIWQEGLYDVQRLRAQTDLGEFLWAVQSMGLTRKAETQSILLRNFPDFANCLGCPPATFLGIEIDATVATDEIVARIIDPETNLQNLLDQFSYVTRLFTLISPEEMTIDPLFDFDADLPDVSNVHEAKAVLHCGFGGTPGSAGAEIHLTDGTVLRYKTNQSEDRAAFDTLPAARVIAQLAESRIVTDNREMIGERISVVHDETGVDGCSCDGSRGGRGRDLGLGFAAAAFVLLLVRRRR